jgi:murein L,D-transpeptidase YcbB/YkuD
VARAVELGKLVLERVDDWSEERVDETLSSGAETVIALPEPLPIHIVYWTAVAQENGRLRLFHDIYGLDARVRQAIRAIRE